MVTFAVAYVLVWLAVVLYVARLGVRQGHLSQELDSLRSRIDRQEEPDGKRRAA